MNEIKALTARLLQNPNLVKSLANPQALAELAGLGGDQIKALTGLGQTLSSLLAGSKKPAAPRSSPVRTPRTSVTGPGPDNGVRTTAIVGTVALTAVTGAVVAVGTVSAVALSKGRKARVP